MLYKILISAVTAKYWKLHGYFSISVEIFKKTIKLNFHITTEYGVDNFLHNIVFEEYIKINHIFNMCIVFNIDSSI